MQPWNIRLPAHTHSLLQPLSTLAAWVVIQCRCMTHCCAPPLVCVQGNIVSKLPGLEKK